MNEDVRLKKNERIKIKGKATRERHEKMRAVTVSLKLSLGCLNNKERSKLLSYFIQCRWLCNYLLSLSNEEFSLFDTKEHDITSLDKDGNKVERHLDIPAKLIQDVKASLIGDMTALKKKRSKTEKADGKLKQNPRVIVVDMFFPSTKLCHVCGAVKDDITLKDRAYVSISVVKEKTAM